MHFITNRLFCYELIVLASFNIASNIEARLPKHMATKATKLLIEKSGLQLDETKKDSFVKNLAGFLYSTEKRQHFADWMKAAYKATRETPCRGRNQSIDFSDSFCTTLYNDLSLSDIKGWNNDNWKSRDFIAFANSLFPCWTGTLTCFMLNRSNKAFEALCSTEGIAQKCQDILLDTDNTHKVIGILFTLELVDDWKYIQQICKQENESDNSKLEKPSFVGSYDPYDCVPVPNTAYEINDEYAGTCLISTVRNILCIFSDKNGQGGLDTSKIQVQDYVKAYLNKFDTLEKLAAVSGITSIDEQNMWAGTLLIIRNLHYPILFGFVRTLAELSKYEQTQSLWQDCVTNNSTDYTCVSEKMQSFLEKIFGKKFAVSLTDSVPEKKTKRWPELLLTISSTESKTINIGIGKIGQGDHIEIIKIE